MEVNADVMSLGMSARNMPKDNWDNLSLFGIEAGIRSSLREPFRDMAMTFGHVSMGVRNALYRKFTRKEPTTGMVKVPLYYFFIEYQYRQEYGNKR